MRKLALLLLLVMTLGACAPSGGGTTPGPVTLTVMTHDSFAVSEAVVQSFEDAHQVDVVFLQAGDAGAMLNRAILSRDAPLADVLYGVDNTFLSRALEADLFEPYRSPALDNVPAAFQLDPAHRVTPVDYADVCLNYDIAWLERAGLPAPQSLEDLTRPEYRGLLVVENPATSSPGLAFLLATVAHFGDPGYLDYWRALRANDVAVVDGWETAYYVNFSASSGRGPHPIVVSYASSPAAEVIYADPPRTDAPTAAVIAPGTCFRQIEFAGILRGTSNRALSEKFIDFLLGRAFQEDMPLQMFVYPVRSDAQLPEAFVRYARAAQQPAALDPALIASRREEWIRAWTEAVLR